MRQLLVSSWARRGPLALLLWPLSILYGALVALRTRLYQVGVLSVERVAVPVVVVGNVIAGGAGKTPVVMALVEHLRSQGRLVGVISRGYGRRTEDCREVKPDSLATDVGDEPILIKRRSNIPVFVARARIDAARALLKQYPLVDILVCDDGLQHHGLHRDVEICVFDDRAAGNGFILPAGPLRESWPRKADLVLSTTALVGTHAFKLRRELSSDAQRADGTRVALTELRASGRHSGRNLWAVAAIARPEVFFAMLRARGLQLQHTIALADHADFDGPEWSGSASDHVLLCTEKDATKLWKHRPDALSVPLLLHVDPQFWPSFDQLVKAALAAKLSSSDGHSTS